MNNRTDIRSKLTQSRNVLEYLWLRFRSLKNRYSSAQYDKLLNPIEALMNEETVFPYLFWFYFKDYFPSKEIVRSRINRSEEVKNFGDLIRNLESNENQTMALRHQTIDEIYHHGIVKVSNFTLNRHSKLINDFRSTSTLYYDVILPFNDKNYDGNSANCTRLQDLPWFFKYYSKQRKD